METYLIIIVLVVVLVLLTYFIVRLRKQGKGSVNVLKKHSFSENPTSTLREEKHPSEDVISSRESIPKIIEHVKLPATTSSPNKSKAAPPKKEKRKQVIPPRNQNSKENVGKNNNLRKMAFIWRKPNDIDSCYRCDGILETEIVNMATSSSLYSKGKDIKYIEAMVLTCNTCRYVCADENMILKMKQISKGSYIDIRNWGLKETKQPKSMKQEPTSSSQTFNNNFKWPSTYAVETIKRVSITDGFEKESGLHRIGYKISGISRQRRWWILEHEALPKLGLQQVANTIAANVRARKRQRGGKQKYAYAIVEWEHDLEELKKYYYHRDFTWPHTD